MVLLEGQKGYFLQDFSVENSDFSQRHEVFGTMRISEEKRGGWRDKKGFLFSLTSSPGQLIIKL